MRKEKEKQAVALALLVLAFFAIRAQCLLPTAPILATPNTESSPSNMVLSFSLTNDLPTSAYLMIVFPFYETTIVPKSCTLLNQMVTTAVTCQNLNLASASAPNPLTINATRVNDLNPNVQSTKTIVTSFSQTLLKGTSYSIQVILQDNLPAIGALSESFQMYAMSSTGVMLEENWNMGQVYLEMRNNNLMSLVSITGQTTTSPGIIFSTVVEVTVGVACPTLLSTFVFTVSGNFQFTVSSQITGTGVTGSPPQILSSTVVSPNIIRIIFNEQFAIGRQFRLTISNIYNPMEISQGALSLYSMPYNSITPLEVSEMNIPYQTSSFVPTLTLYTAEGVSPSAPMEFYMDTVQYITLTILLPRALDPNFIVQVKSDALAFQTGTAYLKTSTLNSNTLTYSYPNGQTIQIKGFPYLVPSGTLLTLTFSAWIATNPIFNIYVSIDIQTHVDANTPIIYGTTSATVSAIPEPFISAFTGNAGEPNSLTAMTSTTSSISFSVTPLFQTYSGSFLKLYTSKYMKASATFSGSTSCLVNSVAQPCTISTTSAYTVITIASSSSVNLYPISATTPVQISQLSFDHCSSHSSFIFHFYFQLTVSLAQGATVKKSLLVPPVMPERSKLTNFNVYFSNNIYNSGSNFLNVIRLVSSDPSQWQNVIQVNQRRIISIFAYQGWTSLFTTLNSYSSYPCNSNLQATFTYIQGANSQNLTTQYPLNWDRINIVLPGTESSTMFSIIIPTLFTTNADYLFEVMVGYVDLNNGEITYLQAEARPVSGASTFLTPANIAVYSKPKQTAMQLNIAGLAGSYSSNSKLTVAPSATYQGTTYSSCILIVSSWQFYDSLTALSATSLGAVDPHFANIEQTPLSIKISETSFLTHIPFKTLGVYATNFDIILDNLKLPYNLDLPYYSISLIDKDGALDGYNQFINKDQNIFYTGVLKSLALSCNDNSMGVTNTDCTLIFSTFQEIEVKSVLILALHGMYVSTNLCSMVYTSTGSAVPVATCTPNTDKNVLTVSLGNTARLPAGSNYSLTVNGMSIDSVQRSNYIKLQVMDPTGSYSIQQKTVILMTSVTQNFPIYISQVNFKYNNPVVLSELYMNFTLPRALNQDEAFALVLNKDFITLNNVPSKITIRLMQSDGVTEIVTFWVMKPINSQIIFEHLQGVLVAGAYSLELYGIQTPSTVGQDMIAIIFLRLYDNTYAKTNTLSSTASFPVLTSKVDSLITLQTYFNTEGTEQELMFTVVNQFKAVTQNTLWLITLPIYYSPRVWNDVSKMYCTISGTPLSCKLSTYTRYQMVLYNSPIMLSAGSSQTYTINIYGITCPRAAYLNGNTMFSTEELFFAVAQSSSSTSFADYSSLFISNPVLNPMTQSSYGSIIITNSTSSNMQVYQTTFFTITAICSVDIPIGSWFFVTFPQEFNNFNNIPVVVQTQSSVANYEVSTSSVVVNTRIAYQLNTIALTGNSEFQIMITSLLTPTADGVVDINKIKIVVASSDRLSTKAVSVDSRNRAAPMTFLPNSLHLVVNNYQHIQLTAGTYSSPIRINPSDNSTFLTNMMVSFTSAQLTFLSNPTYLYLGNSYSTVIIGAGQNTIPTTYSFNLVKKETSISAYYSTLSDYAVLVTSVPVSITFPSSFSVPRGGCSMPVSVSLTNAPHSYITIYYEYNTTAVLPQWFWVNQETTYEQMEFNINYTKRWISFCSSPSIGVTDFDITLNLGGDNAPSFSFTNKITQITIDSSVAAVAPSFSISPSNVQKTFATVQLTANAAGYFYYQLSIAPLTLPLTLNDIHTYVKSNTEILQSNQDYLTVKIYKSDRDQRVGYAGVNAAGITFVEVQNLLPERSYTMCGYFQNQFGQSTLMQCCNFTMQAWGVISKAEISFSSSILANQLNNLLCFFVKASDSQITQIVDLEGNSCSLSTSPSNYYYAFKGNTTTLESTTTTIYHTAHPNLTSDGSISAFQGLFDSNGITSASLALAQTQFSINFISKAKFTANFQPMQAVQAASGYQPSVSFTLADYVKNSFRVQVTNLRSSLPSTIYFVLVSYKNITTNQISSTTTISIRPIVTPSEDQIASCTDGQQAAVVQCRRVVMLPNTDYSFSFQSLTENSVYALHYAYANEYPQRPIFSGGVKTQYIFTTTSQRWISLLAIAAMALLMLF